MDKPAIIGGVPVRKNFLPPFRPYLGEEEIQEVTDTIRSGWLTVGPKTNKFEEMFKEYVGSKYAVSTSSCTAALHLALVAFGVSSGDEVITVPFTFTSTVNVILHQQAKPVFVDIEMGTYTIDVNQIEEKITEKTKAIIPVHYAGHPAEMDRIMKIAKQYELSVIEDAAHAIGAEYKGRKIGTIGDVTCFSFYATKNLATGEGGMVTTDAKEIADKIRLLRLHGISKDAWKRYTSEGSWYYEVIYPGYKYNMTDIQAAIGIHQLKKLEKMQKRREDIAKIYHEAFENMDTITTPVVKNHVRHAWHLYPILIETKKLRIDRNQFIEALKAENVGTSVHFIPVHLHPCYRKRFGFKEGDFPVSEYVYEREVSLPIYPSMTGDEVEDVILAVKKIVNHYKR